jgi:hypothetical protein
MTKTYPNGVPCEHPGCWAHRTHPCEGCGRIGSIGDVTVEILAIGPQIEPKKPDSSFQGA